MSLLTLEIDFIQTAFTQEPKDETALLGGEYLQCASFAEKRRKEFATGRYCAREAFLRLGVPVAPIPIGRQRQPCWPSGVSGSISHTKGLTGAMVAWQHDFSAVGLDIEQRFAVSTKLHDRILTPSEQSWIQGDAEMATLVFSVKEAFYKMQFPLTGLFLDFTEVEVSQDLGSMKVLKVFPAIGSHRLGHKFWNNHIITWALAYGETGCPTGEISSR